MKTIEPILHNQTRQKMVFEKVVNEKLLYGEYPKW